MIRRTGAAPSLIALAAESLLGPGLLPGPAPGQWVEARGRGWIDVTAYHVDTRTVFGSDGKERRSFSEGHAVSTSDVLTMATGLGHGVDAWVQVPYHRGERSRRLHIPSAFRLHGP